MGSMTRLSFYKDGGSSSDQPAHKSAAALHGAVRSEAKHEPDPGKDRDGTAASNEAAAPRRQNGGAGALTG